jgi:hypothetical protein
MPFRGTVGRFWAIDVVGAVLAAAAWYWGFARFNHRLGLQTLRRMEAACSGQARIVDARWLTASRLEAKFRFASHWFDHANLTVRLFPRPLPLQWLLCLFRKQKETLTFEADLDGVPTAPLEVIRHRWYTQGPQAEGNGSREWTMVRPGPIVFTTRPEWTQGLPPVVNTFMTSRGHSLLSVRFRPESPHLAATVPLETLCDRDSAASFFSVLRDLAAGASTPRQ